MVRSMTGFGKAVCEIDGSSVSIELSSVNHRYLDPSVRMPYEWAALEGGIRDALKKKVSRGKVNINVNCRRGSHGAQSLKLDTEVAQQYVLAARELKGLLGAEGALELNTLARLEGVFRYEQDDQADLEAIQVVLLKALDEAADQLNAMRALEGKSLCADVGHRLGLIRESVGSIESRLPEVNAQYESRLQARIAELNSELRLSEDRIAIELAVMAEKGDVTEEVVRLKAHLDHMDELLELEEPVGRTLNFLTQEIQREMNTLGSKVRDTDVVRDVLQMKSELEKIREQIQNIE